MASKPLKKWVIVRDIPNIGSKTPGELASISKGSCDALVKVGTDVVQWQQSYVTDNRTHCIYLAADEEAIRRHAQAGGIPITSIEEVRAVIDPSTASNA